MLQDEAKRLQFCINSWVLEPMDHLLLRVQWWTVASQTQLTFMIMITFQDLCRDARNHEHVCWLRAFLTKFRMVPFREGGGHGEATKVGQSRRLVV